MDANNRSVGIIPARGGSKGIPKKNLAMCAGKTLLQWTIEAAKASRLDRVLVSTDDDEIEAAAASLDTEVIRRPARLATDTARTVDVLCHAAKKLTSYGVVVCLQPTNPCREVGDINQALAIYEANPGCHSVISVVEVGDWHPSRMCWIDGKKLWWMAERDRWMPRQQLPTYYLRDGGVYLVRRDILMEGWMDGTKALPLVVPAERSIRIDDHADLLRAEQYLTNRKVKPSIPTATRRSDKRIRRRRKKTT